MITCRYRRRERGRRACRWCRRRWASRQLPCGRRTCPTAAGRPYRSSLSSPFCSETFLGDITTPRGDVSSYLYKEDRRFIFPSWPWSFAGRTPAPCPKNICKISYSRRDLKYDYWYINKIIHGEHHSSFVLPLCPTNPPILNRQRLCLNTTLYLKIKSRKFKRHPFLY